MCVSLSLMPEVESFHHKNCDVSRIDRPIATAHTRPVGTQPNDTIRRSDLLDRYTPSSLAAKPLAVRLRAGESSCTGSELQCAGFFFERRDGNRRLWATAIRPLKIYEATNALATAFIPTLENDSVLMDVTNADLHLTSAQVRHLVIYVKSLRNRFGASAPIAIVADADFAMWCMFARLAELANLNAIEAFHSSRDACSWLDTLVRPAA